MTSHARGLVRALGGLAAATAGFVLLASPAGAHLAPDKDEVPAGSYTNVTLTVGHGCEESPTNELSIQIPEGLTSVSPAVNPGWEIEMVEEVLDEPIEGPHGEIDEVVTEVIYTAEDGNELPDAYRTSFTLGFHTTAVEPGDYLFFKSVQSCEDGEHAWVEEYVEGVTEGEEPEEPAPTLLVTEAEGDHGGDEEEADEADTDDAAEADPAVEEAAATSDDAAASDESDETGLAFAGLAVGVLGLAVGGFALYRTRSA